MAITDDRFFNGPEFILREGMGAQALADHIRHLQDKNHSQLEVSRGNVDKKIIYVIKNVDPLQMAKSILRDWPERKGR